MLESRNKITEVYEGIKLYSIFNELTTTNIQVHVTSQ